MAGDSGARFLSIAECVRLEGKALEAVRDFDLTVRSAALAAGAGHSKKDQLAIRKTLTTVLMGVAIDMAFASAEEVDRNVLRAMLQDVLDDCFSWSAQKNLTARRRSGAHP